MKIYRQLKKIHRKIGLCSAIFVVLLCITGLALNHTEELNLDEQFIGSSILLDLYNISLPAEPTSYATESHQVTRLGERLYLNDLELTETAEQLYGAIEIDDMLVVSINEAILLFELDGELIEKLGGSEGVPAGMERIGLAPNNQLVVQAAHGHYYADLDSLEWTEKYEEASEHQWALATELDEPLKTQLTQAYRGKGLTFERVILDLHSGRILGNWGVYLVDAAAILFLLLAITGIWMWSKRG